MNESWICIIIVCISRQSLTIPGQCMNKLSIKIIIFTLTKMFGYCAQCQISYFVLIYIIKYSWQFYGLFIFSNNWCIPFLKLLFFKLLYLCIHTIICVYIMSVILFTKTLLVKDQKEDTYNRTSMTSIKKWVLNYIKLYKKLYKKK